LSASVERAVDVELGSTPTAQAWVRLVALPLLWWIAEARAGRGARCDECRLV
jgi:hypothetical protein